MEKVINKVRNSTSLSDEAELIHLLTDVAGCFKSGDINKAISLHTDDVVLIESNMPLIQGKQAMKEFFVNFFNELKNKETLIELDFSIAEMEILHPRAFIRGHVFVTKTEKGMTPVESKGKFFCLFAQQPDGSWLRSHIISNTDEPGGH